MTLFKKEGCRLNFGLTTSIKFLALLIIASFGLTGCGNTEQQAKNEAATEISAEEKADEMTANVDNEVSEAYAKNLIEKINSLPQPEFDNCEQCYDMFSTISWDHEGNAGKEDFAKAKNEYAKKLHDAYFEAGWTDEDMPSVLVGDDYKRFM